MSDSSVTVRMPVDLVAALRRQSAREDRPVSAVVRVALRDYLRRNAEGDRTGGSRKG